MSPFPVNSELKRNAPPPESRRCCRGRLDCGCQGGTRPGSYLRSCTRNHHAERGQFRWQALADHGSDSHHSNPSCTSPCTIETHCHACHTDQRHSVYTNPPWLSSPDKSSFPHFHR